MPALTLDQLQALALSGLTNAMITAQLGRAMTAAEKQAVDRARGLAKVRKAKAAQDARHGQFGQGSDNPKVNAETINDNGRTPRQEVDYWRAMQIKARVMREAGELVYRADVANAVSRQWEMVGNDLRYTLPTEVADRLTGKVANAVIRKAVREAVETIIDAWKQGGSEYGPKADKPATGRTGRNSKRR